MLEYGFALKEQDTSKQFCDVFKNLLGNGISQYGNQFNLSTDGTKIILETGFALADGHYLRNDEPFEISLELASNFKDRYDVVCIKVDYAQKIVNFDVITDIDIETFDVNQYRNDVEYIIVLYFVRIRKGSTVINFDDISDKRADNTLCGYLLKSGDISSGIEYAYNLIKTELDERVQAILNKYDNLIQYIQESVTDLKQKIQLKNGEGVGDITISKNHPKPENIWLLCNGQEVPEQYTEYRQQIGTNTPIFNVENIRFKAYIYVGDKEV